MFWIEYIKIKNENCYGLIKNYFKTTPFSTFQSIIDFNDDIYSKEKINGTRERIIGEFNTVSHIFNSLFPINHNESNSLFNNKLDADLLERELRINSSEHFDKYFSYHTYRKISSLKINKIKELIKRNDSDELILLLKDLFLDESQHYKMLYRIESIIKELTSDNERDFFYEFLFENIQLIPESRQDIFGLDYKVRVIESIASVLNGDITNDNKTISLKLAEKLNIFQLCHFTRKFKEDKLYKKEFEKLIAIKAQEFEIENPFYKDPTCNPNKMIMHYWKLGNETEYNEYINKTIINEDNIKLLIRNFSPFWDNSYFGSIEQENYEYLKKLVDVDFIYCKLLEFNPELVNSIDFETYEFTSFDECTIEQNLEQFIYWHQKTSEV